MCRRLICLFIPVLVLGMASNSYADLVAHWRLDEGSGTTAFDLAGGHDATINGNPQWVAGKVGGALQFDGNGDYVDCGSDPAYDIPVNITVMCWIKVNAFTTTWQAIVTHGDNSWRVHRSGSTNNIAWGTTGLAPLDLTGTTDVSTGDWFHVAGVYDGTQKLLYINGLLDASASSSGSVSASAYNVNISENAQATGRYFNGIIDDVKIYNNALTQGEIEAAMKGQGFPLALSPTPADGAKYEQTWANLSWRPGDFAVSHNVYLGESYDDVNDATTDSPLYRGNQTDTFILAGFYGYPFPDGLVPGTTYYWRIDEVNDANAASPWKGKVWSFWIPPVNAYAPSPVDGSRFVAPAPKLTWSAGFSAKLHYVYFGDNFDTVSNAPAGTGTPASSGSFTPPGPLEPEKTYYWRVDAVNPPITTKGDVWSFTIGKVGGGVLADYFKGMNFDTYILTRTDPEINFNWGDPGGPDPLVGNDQFSCRWTGEVEAAFTETYRFYAAADDGVRLWVDGVQLVNAWIDQGTTEYNGTIDLVAGNTYAIVMEQYENGGGATAYLRWSSPHTPKQIIPSAALSPPVRARSPRPANGAVGVTQTPTLAWGAGVEAASHEVYFGADPDAVAAATKASPEYAGSKQLGAESYEPAALEWNTTYYWRVDEVNATNPDSPWVGNTWSFTTADYGVLDDFEAYNDIESGQPGSKLIYESWGDGYGVPTNGSTMGYAVPFQPTMEGTIVHGGLQSAPMAYDNTGTATLSEVTRTFAAQDWTANGILTLSIWFYGNTANVPGQLYVKINGVQHLYDGDAAKLAISAWQVWNIDLSKVGTNLAAVTSLAIGVQGQGTTGTLLFDDIGLYPYPRELITPVQPAPTGLVAYFAFDGNANDSVGGNNGTLAGGPLYFPGKVGQAISLDGTDDFVSTGKTASELGIAGNSPRTVTVWVYTRDFLNGGIYDVGARVTGQDFCLRTLNDIDDRWRVQYWGGDFDFTYGTKERWVHFTHVHDGTNTKIYADGVLIVDWVKTINTTDTNPFQIGLYGWPGDFFNGMIDELKLYNRALSAAEAAGAAGRVQPFDKPLGN